MKAIDLLVSIYNWLTEGFDMANEDQLAALGLGMRAKSEVMGAAHLHQPRAVVAIARQE